MRPARCGRRGPPLPSCCPLACAAMQRLKMLLHGHVNWHIEPLSFSILAWGSILWHYRKWRAYTRAHNFVPTLAQIKHALLFCPAEAHSQHVTCVFLTIPLFGRRLPRRRPSTSPPPLPCVAPASVSAKMRLSPPSPPSLSPPRRALAVPPSRYTCHDVVQRY